MWDGVYRLRAHLIARPIPEPGHDQNRHDRNDEYPSRRCPQGDISLAVGPVGYCAMVNASASHIGR